jgi:hypothetical protein
MTDYEGVVYLPEQMAYRAQIDIPSGGRVYEDYFGDDESAALVRELVILVRGLDVPRNFEYLGLDDLCSRLQRVLAERDLVDVPESMGWLALVPMTREVFDGFAGVERRPNSRI